jgi:hypothetical protein
MKSMQMECRKRSLHLAFERFIKAGIEASKGVTMQV